MSQVTGRTPEHLLAAVRDELSRRDPTLAQALLDALVSREADGLDPEVWGPRPSDTELVEATVRGHELAGEARRAVLEQSCSRRDAADRLGVGERHVSTLVGTGELVALEHAGQLRLPTWQFHPDTPKGRLEGIAEVAAAYAGGPVTLTQWVTAPNPALAGRTPARALLEGEVDAVSAAARAGV